MSPDDCSLALRGLQTLGIRLDALEGSTLKVARWIEQNSAPCELLHPAFKSCPGHHIWKRDFSGSTSVFSILFNNEITQDQVATFLNALEIFKIGLSWGGVTSLAVSYPDLIRPDTDFSGRLVRFNIGLEDPDDLINDLHKAMAAASMRVSSPI